jgi:hypothetical protein
MDKYFSNRARCERIVIHDVSVMRIKYTALSLIACTIVTGCISRYSPSLLKREYGEFEWIDLPTLDARMLVCTPKPEVILTKKNNVCIRAYQLPGEDPGFGYMFFIGLSRASKNSMLKRWRKSENESQSFSKWLDQRHDTCGLHETPWMTSMRRDVQLADGTWIRVTAMIHAYNIQGNPKIVPEDVAVAKRMIESIEPKKEGH